MCIALSAACAPERPPSPAPHRRRAAAAMPADPALAEQVKQELLHAWNGYKQHAWGQDDLLPVSKTAARLVRQGIAPA